MRNQPGGHSKIMWWWSNPKIDIIPSYGNFKVWDNQSFSEKIKKMLVSPKSGVMFVSFFLCWLIEDVPVKQLDSDFSYSSLAQKTLRFIGEDKRQFLLIPITLFSGTSWVINRHCSIYRNKWCIDSCDPPKITNHPNSRQCCVLVRWNIQFFIYNLWIRTWMDRLEYDSCWRDRNHNQYFTWISQI